MKKVLFVVENLGGGGAEKVLLTLIKNLDKSKYDITVYTIIETGVYVDEMKKYCKVKHALKDYNKYSFLGKLYYKVKCKLIYKLNIKIVYKWLIKDKYDVEIAFVEGFDTKLVSSSNNENSKKYAWVHIDMIERPYADGYYKKIEDQRNAYSCFQKVVCVSQQAKDQYEKKFNLKNSIVIYNPIDTNEIKKYRKKYEVKKEFVFCAVGRLEDQKGFDRLIEAFIEINKYYPNFILNIIGDGSKGIELKRLVSENKLNDKIKFTGFIKNPYEVMAKSDMLICSSRSEGYSLVVAEGMCLGLPILTTDCTGPNELINKGEFGILVENNLDGITKGILEVFENINKLYEYHELSLKRSSYFGIGETIQKVECLLNE